jgi:regulator of sirC expression with transglutaminase-like and TPR domain
VLSQERLAVVDTQKDSLFIDLCHIAHDLSSLWPLNRTLQGCHSLAKELTAHAGTNSPEPLQHFELVCDFFYQTKKFKPSKSKPTLEKCLLPYTLLSRRGPLEILLPLFIGLSRKVGLQVVVAHYNKVVILKLIVDGKSHFYDFTNRCTKLTSEDLITLVNSGCDCSQVLSDNEVLTKYLLRIKHQSLRERSFLSVYKIQTYLMQYQPFALNHVLDRARAAYAIGDIVKAAEDVSQYLTFSADRINNTRMIKLMRKLNSHNIMKRFF